MRGIWNESFQGDTVFAGFGKFAFTGAIFVLIISTALMFIAFQRR
jgi:hypothetical protein